MVNLKNIVGIIICFSFLQGCVSKTAIQPIVEKNIQPIEVRNHHVKQLNHWQLKGKIAFLQKKKRESATLFWQKNEDEQQLKLTTFLGINLLSLSSKANIHTIEVDGKSYKGENLEALVYSLTGLTLPTQALHYWLKGLSFSNNDSITYHPETNLPEQLTSIVDNKQWLISYSKYRPVNDMMLAHSFSLKQQDLTIKIMINQWIPLR